MSQRYTSISWILEFKSNCCQMNHFIYITKFIVTPKKRLRSFQMTENEKTTKMRHNSHTGNQIINKIRNIPKPSLNKILAAFASNQDLSHKNNTELIKIWKLKQYKQKHSNDVTISMGCNTKISNTFYNLKLSKYASKFISKNFMAGVR